MANIPALPDNDQDDGLRVWNEYVAMVEQAAEAVIHGSPSGEYAFAQAAGNMMQIEVPLEKNLLDFLIEFYCTVFTPRLCDSASQCSAINTESFLNLLQSTIREFVGMACHGFFPFSPFTPGTNTITCSPEVWQVISEHITVLYDEHMQTMNSSDISDTSSVSATASSLDLVTSDNMLIDTAVSRKRRKPDTPVVVSEVRRSTRSTRYCGFKPPTLSENYAKKSCVKPRRVPGFIPAGQQGKSSEAGAPPPPPTPIATMQNWGTKECGVPAEEITEEKLLSMDGGSGAPL